MNRKIYMQINVKCIKNPLHSILYAAFPIGKPRLKRNHAMLRKRNNWKPFEPKTKILRYYLTLL